MTGKRAFVIKDYSELRHVLSHLHNAVEYLVEGRPADAQYELDSITGLLFWDDGDPDEEKGREEEGLQEQVAARGAAPAEPAA